MVETTLDQSGSREWRPHHFWIKSGSREWWRIGGDHFWSKVVARYSRLPLEVHIYPFLPPLPILLRVTLCYRYSPRHPPVSRYAAPRPHAAVYASSTHDYSAFVDIRSCLPLPPSDRLPLLLPSELPPGFCVSGGY